MSDHSTYRTMYMNALIGLENGHLMPWDKDILASAPLPDSVSDPYTTKEMPDVLESMKLTFNAMSIWVDEAKKVNYFSKRFVQLSRMVMNGVTAMGRGLVTLHQRGEDLSQSPMSIQDLLGVASYHFRKSYLGVLQTSRSHPEIGERLLMNQIGWNNMLMRLFKTRDKLAEPVVSGQCSGGRKDQGARIQDSGASGQEARALPDTSDLLVQALRSGSQISGLKSAGSTLAAPSALTEPGAFTAPRAFSAYENKKSEIKNQKSIRGNEDGRNRIQESGTGDQKAENEDGRVKNEETKNKLNEAEIEEKQKNKVNEAESHDEQNNRESKTKITEEQLIGENETENNEKLQIKKNDQDSDDEKNQKENQPGRDNETGNDLPTETQEDQPSEENMTTNLLTDPPAEQLPNDKESPVKGQPSAEELSSPDVDNGTVPSKQSPEPENMNMNSPVKEQSQTGEQSSPEKENGTVACRQQSPAGEEAPTSDLPPYMQIMKNVLARGGPTDNEELTFTFDEICYLAADRDFNRIYPEQAAQMRMIIKKMNSS